MTTKEIFLLKLKQGNYQWPGGKPYIEDDFNEILAKLEPDSENVFHAIYGEKLMEGRGTGNIKEYIYRHLEAKRDVRDHMIKMTMHYLVMQIHIGAIPIQP